MDVPGIDIATRQQIKARVDEYRARHGCDPELVVLGYAEWMVAETVAFKRYGHAQAISLNFDSVPAVCFEKPPVERRIMPDGRPDRNDWSFRYA